MASVNFLIRSAVKKNDPFTVRFQFSNPSKVSEKNPFGLDFVETKSAIYVHTPEEVKEQPLLDGSRYWKEFKKYKGTAIPIKEKIASVLQQQNDLREFILDKYSQIEDSSKLPDKEWLTSIVKEYNDSLKRLDDEQRRNEKPHELVWHFDNYIRLHKRSLQPRTVLKLEDTKNIILGFEEYHSAIKGYSFKVLIPQVDEILKTDLTDYLVDVKSYANNTVAKTIKVIRTICNSTKEYNIPLSATYHKFTMAYESKEIVYLSFDELRKIKNAQIPKKYEDARNWLYLSCFLGQRISDFMRFNKNMIRKEGEDYFIDLIQAKTNKKMELMLHPVVVEYLQENDFNFPDAIDEPSYNDQIREVCKLAGITKTMTGSVLKEIRDGVWRNVPGEYPKYELISSHIGRKSFCTNHYGKMPTSLIMYVSGHSDEATLKSYIGKNDEGKNKELKKMYNQIKY